MKIEASSVYNLKTIKALAHLNMYKGKNPIKMIKIWLVVLAIIFLVAIFDVIAFGYDISILFMLLVIILVNLIFCFLYFQTPKIQYKSLSSNGDIENNFIFYDDNFETLSKREGYNGNSKIKYNTLFKIVENQNYLFLYENKLRVYIVDKSTIKSEEIEILRNRLFEITPSDKYIICKGW